MTSPEKRLFEFYSGFLNTVMSSSNIDQKKINKKCQRAFINICQKLKPVISLEVGAYEGGFSRDIKRRCPDIEAYAFEANPHVFNKFQSDLSEAGVKYLNLCANISNDPVEIKIPKDYLGTERKNVNQMASIFTNSDSENYEVHKINAVRVDEYIQTQTNINRGGIVTWVDVEGALEPVLSGMQKLFPRIDAMYIETETKPLWDGQWLESDAASYLMQQGFVPVAKDRQRPWQSNWMFVSERVASEAWIQRRIARIYGDNE